MKFKAFIFDLDGTLVDSIQDLANSVNYSLEKQGYPTLSLEDIRIRIGHGIDKLVISSLPVKYQNNKKIIARTLELMAQHYSTAWKNNTKLYPHIPQVLDKCMINKIPIAIISNKPEPFVLEIVEFLLKKWDFIAIYGGAKLPLKPNPQSTLSVIKKMNLPSTEIAFVGDGDTDIKTAIAAGITPLAATWGFRTKDELTNAGATVFLEDPLDLLNFI